VSFEWDAQKNRINIDKHGLSFQTASKVFLDPYRVEVEDIYHSSKRGMQSITIGRISKLVLVVFTRNETVIRIISARLATKDEAQFYYDNRWDEEYDKEYDEE